MIGERFGHYRVLTQLGAGGMGTVYLAVDEVLGRKVAIKLLNLHQQEDAQAKARFQREARAIAALNHPNIAVLYEAGEIDGQPFLAMEHVEGKTLHEALQDGPFPAERWLKCATSLASALQHAHQHGVLHRDVKSSNVILTADDTPKLLDFGLAQFCAVNSDADTETELTVPGTWVGTLQYAAPEVLSGHAADFRADVYSLGAVLYEMACGDPPFAAWEGRQLVGAILQGAVSPSRHNSAIPAHVSRIIERAMAREPGDRVTAAELVAALQELASRGRSRLSSSPGPELPILAILEFQNIGGDPAADWLRTGITETLTTDLQKVRSIRVASPERVRALERQCRAAQQEIPLAELGNQMGAQWAVTGSYQRAESRLRITSRMVKVATGDAVYTTKVDGAWIDIFDLQDRLVHDLMSALHIAVDDTAEQSIAVPGTRELEAYEHYAYARRKFHEMGKTSLEEARLHFESALALDPNYAVAHSGLGASYAMRYIHRTDPDDLTRALGHLERARELDPELGEPYPFLCYVYMRRGQLEPALAAGKRGVELQPDLAQGHYFLGAAHVVSAEADPRHYQPAVDCLGHAIEVEPGWEASWIVLAEIALLDGNYDRAEEYLEYCLEIERGSKVFNRFLGIEIILGTVWLRRGNLNRAVELYTQALRGVATVDHAYREASLALAACLRAEAYLRQGKMEEALADLHYAWRTVKEYPRMLGQERITVRALSGMASAYAANRELSRAQGLARQASAALQGIFHRPEGQIPHTAVPYLCHAQALTLVRVGDHEGALEMLEEACRTGWRDAEWMMRDEELAILQEEPRFQEVVRKISQMTAIVFPVVKPSGSYCSHFPEAEAFTARSAR